MKSDVKAITKALDRISGHQRRGNVWDDWLDMVEATLRMLPTHAATFAATGQMADDDAEAVDVWARLRRAGYDAEDFTHFGIAFRALMDAVVEPDGSPNYRDVLAIVHEDWAGANTHAGQYLTPYDICHTMALCTMVDVEKLLAERIVAAIGTDAVELLGIDPTLPHSLEYLATSVLPHHVERFDPITVCDPCCGSGTFFLACAAVCPQWAVRLGLIRFYGQDIDRTAVQMSRINLMARGLNGYGLRLRVAADPLIALLTTTSPDASTVAELPSAPDLTTEAGATDLFGTPLPHKAA